MLVFNVLMFWGQFLFIGPLKRIFHNQHQKITCLWLKKMKIPLIRKHYRTLINKVTLKYSLVLFLDRVIHLEQFALDSSLTRNHSVTGVPPKELRPDYKSRPPVL